MSINVCLRCAHEWHSKSTKPTRCAKCKAYNWWRPARTPKERIKRPRGRPTKYDLSNLGIGQSKKFPWFLTDRGPDEKKNHVMHTAIVNYAKRHNFKIKIDISCGGLIVNRIA
jgi:hypothetical protein